MLLLKKGERQPKKKQGYQIDNISESFRLQIYYLMEDTLGKWNYSPYGPDTLSYPANNKRWDAVEHALLREFGTRQLAGGSFSCERILNFIRKCDPTEFLKVILVFLALVQKPAMDVDVSFESVLGSIHTIFRTHHFEYEIIESAVGPEAIRIDSQYLHEEVIKKTRKLLHDLKFLGPLEEFDEAIEALEKQDTDGAITKANKAFESTMKAISQELKQPVDPPGTASKLITAMINAGVISTNLQSLSDGIRTVLSSGLTTLRNQPGAAHGAGRDPKEIERSYAQFAMNLCGSYIVFLIERYQEIK
jgi:hypothetical protein